MGEPAIVVLEGWRGLHPPNPPPLVERIRRLNALKRAQVLAAIVAHAAGLDDFAANLLLSDVILAEHADEAYGHTAQVRVFQSLPGMDQVRKIGVWNGAIPERSDLLLNLAWDAD